MSRGWVGGVVAGLFDAVFRPSEFVTASSAGGAGGLRSLRRSASLSLVYAVNLVLYAGPLTLAGFGVDVSAAPPAWFRRTALAALGDTATIWQLGLGFAQNCAFLLVASVLTLVTCHAGVVLTRNSAGPLRTLHTVVYSTSAYLAGIFTVVWYLSTNGTVVVARDFVVAAQAAFIYYFIDLFDAGLGLPGGRPAAVPAAELSHRGTLALALLALMALYYLYSLYLGTRINHGATRTSGLLVVAFVVCSPALYVVGLILVYTGP